jgi:predicted alpha/beta-hydrolase family hydrolase
MDQDELISSTSLGGTQLQAIYSPVANEKGAVLLSHNLSGDLNHTLIAITAEELNKRGYSTLRYNFHWVEKGIVREDVQWENVESDINAAFDKLVALSPSNTYYLIGKSIGATASLYMAATQPQRITGLGLVSIAIPSINEYLNIEDLRAYEGKAVILHGEKDRFGTPDVVQRLFEGHLRHFSVTPLINAEHGFEASYSEEQLLRAITEMLDNLLPTG